ncbi:hypothetical protein CC80DRAFT_271638 [Byssothecium circinans]|uniref:Uncharacterized protein n=1 Tax=Byssothecium circinans TaxID=147558 RepID=A0A6A5T8X8_9PLEO|nr:hypothetical protein CC80DRAFT_271638 [Byssothecium circinans]
MSEMTKLPLIQNCPATSKDLQGVRERAGIRLATDTLASHPCWSIRPGRLRRRGTRRRWVPYCLCLLCMARHPHLGDAGVRCRRCLWAAQRVQRVQRVRCSHGDVCMDSCQCLRSCSHPSSLTVDRQGMASSQVFSGSLRYQISTR